MNKQRGFTLLEIILALVIFASCAMMVVSTIPSRSGADIFGQQLKALVEYGSDRAVMDGNIVGLVVTTSEYQLVTWAKKRRRTSLGAVDRRAHRHPRPVPGRDARLAVASAHCRNDGRDAADCLFAGRRNQPFHAFTAEFRQKAAL